MGQGPLMSLLPIAGAPKRLFLAPRLMLELSRGVRTFLADRRSLLLLALLLLALLLLVRFVGDSIKRVRGADDQVVLDNSR